MRARSDASPGVRARLLGALLGLVSVVAVTSVVVEPPSAHAAATVCTDLEINAHRGYHYPKFDENSMRGMAEAANRGYAIETDVWADAEGQLWVFHDRDVYRTTGVQGNIDQMTTAQVAALRYKKAGSPLPRFEEALALWQTYPGLRIYMEPNQREQTLRMAQMVRDAGLVSRFYFTEYAAYLNNNAPDMLLQLKSFSTNPDPSTLVASGVDSLQVGVEQLTAADVDSYHAVGVEVQTKTTNTTRQWRDAIAKGFDGVLTDFPNELKEFCPLALLPPDITSFTPSTGPVGTAVTITGSNFYDATAVRFGTALAAYTVDSPTQITATVPSTTVAGPVQIRVVNRNGDDISEGSFTVAAPVISSFVPSSGPAGTAVTLTGSNFTGATSVTFGTTPASFTVSSDTQIATTVPEGLPPESKIWVTTPGGTVSSVDSFTMSDTAPVAPNLSSFTPTNGPAGTVVTLTGSDFTGATSVKFGAVASTFTVDSDTQITTTAPAGLPSQARISVSGPGGTAESTGFFATPSPVISSFTPTSGAAGTTVTLAGANFTAATSVKFGTVAVSAFTVDSDSQITTTVPSGVPVGSKITVTTPAGSGESATAFNTPAPTISSFTPARGPAGTVVTVTGSRFTGVSSVKFGTVDAAFTVNSATQITATVPTGFPAKGKISVTTPGGTAVSGGYFLAPAPVIASFTPSSGAPGTVVTIAGNHFNDATAVKFGTVSATEFVVESNDRITVTVPAGAPAKSRLLVVTPAGSGLSAASFSIPPVIASFTPSSGQPGSLVTITGSHFTGATAVKFGSVAASFTVDSATQITATVPPGAPAKSKLLVATPGGTVQSTTFYSVPPVITSFTPSRGAPGTVVTITGTTFTGTSAVRFGSVLATFRVDSATQITATVPSGIAALSTIAVTTPGGTGRSSEQFTRA